MVVPKAIPTRVAWHVLRRWAGTGVILLLLALAMRALWIESTRYRLLQVAAGAIQPALPVGHVALTSHVPVGQLGVGDVIDFRHPSRPAAPSFLRVGEIARVAGSSGYLLRLESADARQEPWHAELHGVAWRVVASRDRSELARDLYAAAGLAASTAVAGFGWRWHRVRSRAVARTYRTDLW